MSDFMSDIVKILDKNRILIDSRIEKLIPKKADSDFLERIAGHGNFSYDINQLILKIVVRPQSQYRKIALPACAC